jgi:hypothetical protein
MLNKVERKNGEMVPGKTSDTETTLMLLVLGYMHKKGITEIQVTEEEAFEAVTVMDESQGLLLTHAPGEPFVIKILTEEPLEIQTPVTSVVQ